MSESTVVHTEVMKLRATPAQVRKFIMTPERILDYYPGGAGGGVIEVGRSIYCYNDSGASLLEIDIAASSDQHIVLNVTSAADIAAPYSKQKIIAAAFFTMIEDWLLEESDEGTVLTKIWRDVTAINPLPFSIEDIVRESAANESEELIHGWNLAASLGL